MLSIASISPLVAVGESYNAFYDDEDVMEGPNVRGAMGALDNTVQQYLVRGDWRMDSNILSGETAGDFPAIGAAQ